MLKNCLVYIFISFLFLNLNALAQQQGLYSQYMFNGLAINPAYAGSSESINVTGLWRKQWSGIKGAPTTQTFSVHSPLKKEKIGLGLLVINDKVGVTRQTSAWATYAYRIIFAKTTLALGLQGGMLQYNSGYGSLKKKDDPDNLLSGEDERGVRPGFGTGVFFYGEKFYLGLSAPQLLKNYLSDNSSSSSGEIRHYFLTGGYVFFLNHDLKLKPNFLATMVEGAPAEVDINMNLLIKELIWTGVSCRSFNSLNFLMQIRLLEQMNLGYSYDIGMDRFNSFAHGSHEFAINYNFSYSSKKVLSPRYF